ncbi:MAG: aminopeptidase P family protein [Deltaproteobacteria bacterium]|nr:aminopeptidase P family protein [Deltaproteobacteria bacterium]
MQTEPLFPRFTDEEYARRARQVRAEMAERELDALLVYGAYGFPAWDYNQTNLRYLTNYTDPTHAYLVFPREGEPTLFIYHYEHLAFARAASVVGDVRWGGPDLIGSVVARLVALDLERQRIGIVGVNGPTGKFAISLPVPHEQALRARLPQADLVEATDLIEQVRMLKSAEEITLLERGAELTDLAMEGQVKATRPGVRDYDLYAAVAVAAHRAGGTLLFTKLGSTSMTTPDLCIAPAYPSGRVIRRGDVVLNEISVSYAGYSGQLLRPVCVGRPTPEYERLFDVGVETYHRILDVLRPGNTEEDVVAATAPIVDAGLKVVCPVAHGWDNKPEQPLIGIRRRPGASEARAAGTREGARSDFVIRRPQPFRVGQLIVVEPNPSTLDERQGIVVGDLVVITEAGARRLHRYPLELVVV